MAAAANQVKPTSRLKWPSLICAMPPPAQCTIQASRMMARTIRASHAGSAVAPSPDGHAVTSPAAPPPDANRRLRRRSGTRLWAAASFSNGSTPASLASPAGDVHVTGFNEASATPLTTAPSPTKPDPPVGPAASTSDSAHQPPGGHELAPASALRCSGELSRHRHLAIRRPARSSPKPGTVALESRPKPGARRPGQQADAMRCRVLGQCIRPEQDGRCARA
jgi:hypothetical protein